jgi:hypothetical protein
VGLSSCLTISHQTRTFPSNILNQWGSSFYFWEVHANWRMYPDEVNNLAKHLVLKVFPQNCLWLASLFSSSSESTCNEFSFYFIVLPFNGISGQTLSLLYDPCYLSVIQIMLCHFQLLALSSSDLNCIYHGLLHQICKYVYFPTRVNSSYSNNSSQKWKL